MKKVEILIKEIDGKKTICTKSIMSENSTANEAMHIFIEGYRNKAVSKLDWWLPWATIIISIAIGFFWGMYYG